MLQEATHITVAQPQDLVVIEAVAQVQEQIQEQPVQQHLEPQLTVVQEVERAAAEATEVLRLAEAVVRPDQVDLQEVLEIIQLEEAQVVLEVTQAEEVQAALEVLDRQDLLQVDQVAEIATKSSKFNCNLFKYY